VININKNIKRLILIIVFFQIENIQAQQMLGISGSNYAGTNSVYNNPANITDSRYKLYINLISNDVFLANNYVGWNAPYSILQFLTNSAPKEYRNSQNVTIFRVSYYDINTEGGLYHLNALTDTRGPSFLYSLNSKQSFGISSRVRAGLNFSGADLPLANLIRLGTDTLLLKNQNFALSNTNLNLNGYAEIGFTYGQTLKDEDEDFIKIGITVKRVVGIYNSHLNIDKAEYNIINDPAEPKKQILNIDKLTANYGYTTENSFKTSKPSLGWVFGNQSSGSGWGIDLGIIYEYRPETRKFSYREKGVKKLDPSKNKYKFKLGVSLLDFGGINYNSPDNVRNWDVNVTNKLFYSADVSQVVGLDDAYKRLNTNIGLNDINGTTSFTSGLPTSLQINFDYHLSERIYVNSLWVQGLRGEKSVSLKMPSSLSVTPRYETKWFEVAMPFALLDNYSTFTFGIAGRVGPMFLGTDNLGSFLTINRPRGMDLYFGLSVPIFNRPPTLSNACFYEKSEGKGLKFWKKKNR
jgi:Family of unknown function (DUF5723)